MREIVWTMTIVGVEMVRWWGRAMVRGVGGMEMGRR